MTLALPARTSKPRSSGITAINDTGLPVAELEAILKDASDYLDVAKFGVGSAYVTSRLDEKIHVYREAGVAPYFGGTLFEKYFHQERLSEYESYLRDHDINWIEVSNGTVDISLAERLRIVDRLSDDGFTVVAEVGCKDQEKIMPPSEWIREIQAFINAGCAYVITEGRDSGTAGVYRPSGELRTGLVTDIAASVDVDKVIFEAPRGKAQMFFIDLIGPNVNLGNIPPRDLILLEAQRVGLRNETFYSNS